LQSVAVECQALQTGFIVNRPRLDKRRLSTLIVVLAFFFIQGCDDPEPASNSCTGPGTCDPGFKCLEGVCTACVGTECDGAPPTGIGPNGGRICIEDDTVCLDIPAGALDDLTDVAIERTEMEIGNDELDAQTGVYRVKPVDLVFKKYASIAFTFPATTNLEGLSVWHRLNPTEEWASLESTSEGIMLQSEQLRALGLFMAARQQAVDVDAGMADTGVGEDAASIDTGVLSPDTGPPVLDTGIDHPDADLFDTGADTGISADANAQTADTGALNTDAAAADAEPPGAQDGGNPDTGANSGTDAVVQDAVVDAGTDAGPGDTGGAIIGLDGSGGDGATSGGTDATSPPVNNEDASVQMPTDALPADAAEDASSDAGDDDGGGGPSQDPDTGGPPV